MIKSTPVYQLAPSLVDNVDDITCISSDTTMNAIMFKYWVSTLSAQNFNYFTFVDKYDIIKLLISYLYSPINYEKKWKKKI